MELTLNSYIMRTSRYEWCMRIIKSVFVALLLWGMYEMVVPHISITLG